MTAANQLDNLMDQAEQASQNFQAPVPMPANQNTIGLVNIGGTTLAKPSMDDFIDGGGMDVDAYFRVKAEGFRIGDMMQGLIEELVVDIDLSEVTPVYSFRCEVGGQTKFVKSYDGAVTSDAKNFQQEVERLTRVGEKPSGIYQSAEIPVTLVEDLADPKKGSSVTFDEGTRVGLTPSVTGFKPFQTFMKRLRAKNPELLREVVRVKLTHEKRTKGNNEWGVLNFELVNPEG